MGPFGHWYMLGGCEDVKDKKKQNKKKKTYQFVGLVLPLENMASLNKNICSRCQ